jgi:hypothetical protein
MILAVTFVAACAKLHLRSNAAESGAPLLASDPALCKRLEAER